MILLKETVKCKRDLKQGCIREGKWNREGKREKRVRKREKRDKNMQKRKKRRDGENERIKGEEKSNGKGER